MTPSDEVACDNRSLRLRTNRLWAVLHAPIDVLPRPAWRSLLSSEVAELSAVLKEHFACEEKGGYLGDLLEGRPGLSRQAESLRGEHADICEQAAAIESELDTIDGHLEQIMASLRELVEKTWHHEERENDLVQEATLRDMGATD